MEQTVVPLLAALLTVAGLVLTAVAYGPALAPPPPSLLPPLTALAHATPKP
jgi:hypothetical protein